MGLKFWFMKNVVLRLGVPRIKRMIGKQMSLQNMPDILLPTSNSPTRFEIPLEAMKLIQERNEFQMRHIFPFRRLFSIMKNIHLSVDSIQNNPDNPMPSITQPFVEQLQEYSQSVGINQIGFTKLPRDFIFQKFGVLYDNAIVLAMEMSKEKLDQAPSQTTMNMVFGTYDELGKAANKIAAFLREQGYAAQADHPLGGLVLFPPLAQKAGMGWVGTHGLLITPKFGPRVRLAAVYTNIENLPFEEENNHEWIEKYCQSCKRCVKECPPQAIWGNPVKHETGLVTYIEQQSCFEYFAQFYGCSVCIKVCPFSKKENAYEQLRKVIEQ